MRVVSPTIAELGAKLHAKAWRKPYIRGQLAEDLRNLEAIQVPLLKIHSIPRFPDLYKNTANWLLEIDTTARKLCAKAFQDIRDKLIEFTSPMPRIGINSSLHHMSSTCSPFDHPETPGIMGLC